MPQFIVNKNVQPKGDHEVHNKSAGCNYMPLSGNQLDLGFHHDCHSAIREAKRFYAQSNGCAYCCNACHNG